MLRQLLVSLLVLAAAAAAWIYFVPSATTTLAGYGITIPFAPAAPEAQAGPSAGGEGRGRGGRGGFGGRQNNVVTTPVTMATINNRLSAVGEGTASRSVTVTSPVSGTLTEVLVQPGATVEAGDIIARLDDDAEQIALDQAKLTAQDARSSLERTQGLASSNVVATTALTAAQLAADKAELDLRNAQNNLDRRTIRSPISGRVGLIQVTQGNYVPAQTAVTTIDDTSSILVDFWVPERFVASITAGMPVEVTAVALPGQRFTGEVSAIDNRIDTASRTLQIQAEIPNDSGLLRAGMSFSVALSFPGEQYPTVDPLAILWSAEGSYVWRYESGKAAKVMAEIIQRNSDGVLVRGDLQPGDAIITEGLLQLSEGDDVNLLQGPDGTQSSAQNTAQPQG